MLSVEISLKRLSNTVFKVSYIIPKERKQEILTFKDVHFKTMS